MKNFLKYINSAPVPFTMRHYFAFDLKDKLREQKLNSSESWDVLREQDEHFSISQNREEWLEASEGKVRKDGQDGGFVNRAKEISEFLKHEKVNSLYSVGVGGAGLEFQIKKNFSELYISCTEYSKVSVERLKKVFTEANQMEFFDIKNGDWKKLLSTGSGKKMVLMYRIDIDFSNQEMKKIFKSMHDSKVENILIVLCGVITLKGILNRLKNRLGWIMHGKKYAFSGYLRTKITYPTFWREYYSCTEKSFGGLTAFVLEIKK